MWKKHKRVLLSLLLIVGIFLTGVRMPQIAKAAGSDKTGILMNITKTVLQSGKTIENNTIDLNLPVSARLDFQVPVKGDGGTSYVEKGDTASIKLGEGVKIPAGETTPMTREVFFTKVENGITTKIKVGTVKFEADGAGDMYAKFIFDGEDKIFDGTYREVKITAGADFVLKTDNLDPNNLVGKTILVLGTTYNVSPKVNDKLSIEKTHKVNGGRIEWTLTVSRSALGKKMLLTGYKIEDDLSAVAMSGDDAARKQVIESSFKVNGIPKAATYNPTYKTLSYTFAADDVDLNGDGKAVITFETNMGDDFVKLHADPGKHYKNTAKVMTTGGTVRGTAKDEFDWKGFGSKKGKIRENSNLIDWEIVFNEEEQTLNNVTVKDEFPEDKFKSAKLKFKSYQVYKYNKASKGWDKIGNESTVKPLDNVYYRGNVTTKMKVVITTEVEYNTGVEDKSYAFFENTAKVHWDGHPDPNGTTIGGNGIAGKKYATKGPVYPITSQEFVNFESEWNIAIDTAKIANTTNTYAYDYFIFDKDIKATDIRQGNPQIRIEEDGNPSNTNLRQSGVALKDIFKGENNRQRYVRKTITSSDFTPSVKVYKIYAGISGKYVGDLVEVGGFEARKINRFKLTSTLAEGDQLVGKNEKQYAYNFINLIHNGRMIDNDASWPRYNSKITNKQAFSTDVAKKIATSGDYSVDTVNEKIFDTTAQAGIDNKAVAYDKETKSILYRISVNAAGVKNVGDLVVTDKAPAGWEFKNITSGEKYLIYEGESYTPGYNADATVKATNRVTNLSGNNITYNEEADGTQKFTFANIDKPYVILLKAVMKEDKRADYFNQKKTVGNTVDIELLDSHGINKQDVVVDEEILTKKSDDSQLEEGYVNWTITYKPYGFLNPNADITLKDKLGDGLEVRRYKSNNKLIFEGDNFKVLEDGQAVTGTELENMFSYNPTDRTLNIKLRDKTKKYEISYITDIKDKNIKEQLENTVTVLEGAVDLPMKPQASKYIIGDAYAKATLKGFYALRVVKVDGTDDTKKLKGAKFRLKAKDPGNTYNKEKETDENGFVAFDKLIEGNYELVETVAPKDEEGKSYALDATPRNLRVHELGAGFIVEWADGTKSNEITIKNNKPSGGGGYNPPTIPENPSNPENPSKPGDPTKATDPTKPTNPTKPVDPTKPTNPSTPTNPTTPTDTEDPHTPDTTPSTPSYPINNTPDPNDPDSPDEITVIGDDGTPLGKYIKKKKPNGEFEYVNADDETPLGGIKVPTLPRTGGKETVWYYAIGASLVLGAGFMLKKREEEQED